MNDKQESSSSRRAGGVSFFGLLALLFIALKLTNNVQWSWVWVLSPLWAPFSLGLLIFFFGVFMMTRKGD